MGSVITGWWSWLVAIWTVALLFISVAAGFSDESDLGRVAGALVILGFAAAAGSGLVVRRNAPRLAAWLLVVGVGLAGAWFFWALLIPTAIALFVMVSGVRTDEIRFKRPDLVGGT